MPNAGAVTDARKAPALIHRSTLVKLIKSMAADMRVSAEYLDQFEARVRTMAEGHVRANRGKRTLKADVFLGVPAGRGR